jgi:hypothetical protein
MVSHFVSSGNGMGQKSCVAQTTQLFAFLSSIPTSPVVCKISAKKKLRRRLHHHKPHPTTRKLHLHTNPPPPTTTNHQEVNLLRSKRLHNLRTKIRNTQCFAWWTPLKNDLMPFEQMRTFLHRSSARRNPRLQFSCIG